MICILVAGALMASQASHLPPLEFKTVTETGNRELLKQVSRRTAYIRENGIDTNDWDLVVEVHVNGGIGLIVPDGVFVREDDLIC